MSSLEATDFPIYLSSLFGDGRRIDNVRQGFFNDCNTTLQDYAALLLAAATKHFLIHLPQKSVLGRVVPSSQLYKMQYELRKRPGTCPLVFKNVF